ncbi:SRPBCC family protein [Streptomyces sp. NPDC050704]|uniref:SRPBCC family protein n=1 Tax=Streptomyces sp. NPDC050704 TaxID=3157219 RepID=UPI00343DF698
MSATETFRVDTTTDIAADPATVFAYVSDLTRSGDWSPECRGGRWSSGDPATVGSVFTARNHREPEVVGWAPVVRGEWTTECEVLESTPPRVFRWAMRDSGGRAQESVWSFTVAPTAEGSSLTHAFWMGELTEGMRGILARMSDDEIPKFLDAWADKIHGDMRQSLARIKDQVESAS